MQDGHQNISIDASLMCLVQNEEIVSGASHQLSNCHTVCCEYDSCIFAPSLLKSNIIAHFLSYLKAHLLSNSLGKSDGTDPSRL